MVGRWLEWREDKVWDSDRGFVKNFAYGEYIWTDLPDGRDEFKNIWTGERWILEKDDSWAGGSHYRRGNYVYSHRNPDVKFVLSANANKPRMWLCMLAGRPVYRDDNLVRDARTDDTLFSAEVIWPCDAGFAVEYGGTLRFTDGVRKDLPLGEIMGDEDVEFLRVSETEYSIKVGKDRYFLLDAANWTCREV